MTKRMIGTSGIGLGLALVVLLLAGMASDRVILAARDSAQTVRLLVLALALGSTVVIAAGVIIRILGERVSVDEASRQQHLLMESVLGGIRDGVIAADLNGKFLFINSAARRIIGGTETEVDPSQWTEHYGVYRPDSTTPFPPAELPLALAMRGESTDDVEMILRHARLPDDIWVNVSGRPLRDPSGALRGGVVIINDITLRRAMENALRQSEDHFRSLVESIKDDAMFLLDEAGRVVNWNAESERISGFSSDEVVGRHVASLYSMKDTDLGKPQEDLAVATRTGRFEGNGWRIRKNGSPYWASLVMTAIRDGLGAIRGYTAVTRDLSEARRSESRYRALLEATPDAIIIVNQAGSIELANAQTEVLFGYSRIELMGQPVDMLLPGRFRTAHGEHGHAFSASPKRRALGEGRELFGLRKDGTEFPVEISLSPLETEDGVLALAAIRDGTERWRAEAERKRSEQRLITANAELKRSNAELEQFAYVTSHDLQEPLRMVSSYTRLLATRYKGQLDADADEFMTFAADGAARMRHLIQDLLTYSRAGAQDEIAAEISSEEALREALANLKVAVADGEAIVTSGPLPRVTMNYLQLVQVLQNLIGNAIKYRGSESPRIHVTAQLENSHGCVFSVQDNGLGIESKHFEKIFVIFQRLHGRNSFTGTGIGLAICKKVIERQGGRIWVDSELGRGSTFHFALANGRSA